MWLEQIVEPGCPGPFFPGDMQFALQSVDTLQNATGFGFDDGLHHQLATVIQHRDHDRFLVHVHADILDVATHLSCLLGGEAHSCQRLSSPKVKVPWFRTALLEADVNHPESCSAANAPRTFNLLKRGVLS